MEKKPTCPNCNAAQKVHILYSSINNFDIYFCNQCKNGFTHPVPKNITEYYHSNYWISPGLLGKTKALIFNLFHNRRKNWLQRYLTKGKILEIGAGEGDFLKSLGKNYDSIGIEFPTAKIKNKKILRVNFTNWNSDKKFDAIIFWESLEHLAHPQKILQKAHNLLKKGGLVFIEIPRFSCLESRIFANHWFHLDPPRHLAHLTDPGLKELLTRTGFNVTEQKSVLAYEYVVWGFLESILDFFGIISTDYFKKSKFPFFFILLLPLLILAFMAETLFFILDESPIKLVVARNENGQKA